MFLPRTKLGPPAKQFTLVHCGYLSCLGTQVLGICGDQLHLRTGMRTRIIPTKNNQGELQYLKGVIRYVSSTFLSSLKSTFFR